MKRSPSRPELPMLNPAAVGIFNLLEDPQFLRKRHPCSAGSPGYSRRNRIFTLPEGRWPLVYSARVRIFDANSEGPMNAFSKASEVDDHQPMASRPMAMKMPTRNCDARSLDVVNL